MSHLVAALLWLARPAWPQAMTGGGFERVRRDLGPGQEIATEAGGGAYVLKSFQRGFLASSYPLDDRDRTQLMPPPWGFSLYSALATNDIPSAGGGHAIIVPAKAAPRDFDFFFSLDPAVSPMRADPARIAQANSSLGLTAGSQAALAPRGVVELNLMLEDGTFQDGPLAKPATLALSYQDADGDGVVDGTPIRAKTLAVHVLDEGRGAWVRVPGSAVDPAARRVSAALPHLSVYALIGAADTDVSGVYAFPVPWAPNSGDPLDGTIAGGVTFTNLPSEGVIKIHMASGRLARALSIPAGLLPPQLRWDGRTEAGRDAASGVYVWRVESGRHSKSGKLVVVR
jgi:hypothetical protein